MTKGKGDGSRALKKAFKARDHGERGQTSIRKKFGMLEKKKDYIIRAKNFKKKRERLRDMRLAAATKNPDEFNTAMINTQTDEFGRHMKVVAPKKGPQQRRENEANSRYLRYKAAVDGGTVKQMKGSLSFMGMPSMNKHTVFVDDLEQADNFNASEYFDTPSELLNNTSNRPRTSVLRSVDVAEPDTETDKHTARQYFALSERLRRKSKLDKLVNVIDGKQKLLKKGKRALVHTDPKNPDSQKVYKWFYDRKK
eukprot:TRINITY_DN16789_c2_g1_i1.p1 TRINITY_DN16789_c2_g1~~TRINITY_DN16789_c2_g1_i1.p1  ORF type:complete len:253 (+),score=54.35 TRINITY_DN16789_c2_g1_i1:43-801(+)